MPARPVTRRSALAAPIVAAMDARAQAWPDRPVRVVVPYAPGGGADTVARLLFARLAERSGQAVVIENRGGGAGTIGAAIVAKAAPDGATLLHDATAFSVNPALFDRLPYDPVRDFRPVLLAARVPNLLVVHPSVPAGDAAALIRLARATPGGLDMASSGNGTVQHMALALFARAAGVPVNHIPYRGGGPALIDLVAGNVRCMFSNASASIGHVEAGRLRALAHTGEGRLPPLPAVPPLSETLPGFGAFEWNGVFAPGATPEPMVAAIAAALNAVLAEAQVQARLAALSVQAAPNSPGAFADYVAAETAKWGAVVREAGIRLD